MRWLAPEVTTLDDALALVPSLADPQRALDALVAAHVDPTLLALATALVADLLGAPAPPVDPGLAAKRAALARGLDAAELDARERACLAFAERFVLNPHGMTDDHVAAVAAHLDPAALVAFAQAVALVEGFTRARLALGVA